MRTQLMSGVTIGVLLLAGCHSTTSPARGGARQTGPVPVPQRACIALADDTTCPPGESVGSCCIGGGCVCMPTPPTCPNDNPTVDVVSAIGVATTNATLRINQYSNCDKCTGSGGQYLLGASSRYLLGSDLQVYYNANGSYGVKADSGVTLYEILDTDIYNTGTPVDYLDIDGAPQTGYPPYQNDSAVIVLPDGSCTNRHTTC